jgi:hypothetical protein
MDERQREISNTFKRMVRKRKHFTIRVSRTKTMYCINYGGSTTKVWLVVGVVITSSGYLEIITSRHARKLEDAVIICSLKFLNHA